MNDLRTLHEPQQDCDCGDCARHERDRLRYEIEGLADLVMEKERDARRYRWLRSAQPESARWPQWSIQYLTGDGWVPKQGEDLDATVDHCMQHELLTFLMCNA